MYRGLLSAGVAAVLLLGGVGAPAQEAAPGDADAVLAAAAKVLGADQAGAPALRRSLEAVDRLELGALAPAAARRAALVRSRLVRRLVDPIVLRIAALLAQESWVERDGDVAEVLRLSSEGLAIESDHAVLLLARRAAGDASAALSDAAEAARRSSRSAHETACASAEQRTDLDALAAAVARLAEALPDDPVVERWRDRLAEHERREHLAQDYPAPLRDALWAHPRWEAAMHSRTPLREFTGHGRTASCVALSPDGRRIVSGGWDHVVRVFDVATGEQQRELRGHTDWVHAVAWSEDGSLVASGGGDQAVRLWRAAGGAPGRVFEGHDGGVLAVGFRPGGKELVSADRSGTVRVWHVGSGRLIRKFGYGAEIDAMVLAPDGAWVAVATRDGRLRVQPLRGGAPLVDLLVNKRGIQALAIAPESDAVATSDRDGGVQLWDSRTGEVRGRLPLHAVSGAEALAFSPDGRWLAGTGSSGRVRVWDLQASCVAADLTSDADQLVFSSNGRLLFTAAREVEAWILDPGIAERPVRAAEAERRRRAVADLTDPVRALVERRSDWRALLDGRAPLRAIPGHAGKTAWLSFAPDGSSLATVGGDGTGRVWSVASGVQRLALHARYLSAEGIAYSPGGRRLATWQVNGEIEVWDAATGKRVQLCVGHAAMVEAVDWAPNGQTFASASRDGTVRVWDAGSGRELHRYDFQGVWQRGVTYLDASRLLISDGAKRLRLWNPANGTEIQPFRGHAETVTGACVLPEGARVVVVGARALHLFDVALGARIGTAPERSRYRGDISLSASGTVVAAATHGTFVTLSLAEDGRLLRRIETTDGRPLHAAFSPVAPVLATADESGRIELWLVPEGAPPEPTPAEDDDPPPGRGQPGDDPPDAGPPADAEPADPAETRAATLAALPKRLRALAARHPRREAVLDGLEPLAALNVGYGARLSPAGPVVASLADGKLLLWSIGRAAPAARLPASDRTDRVVSVLGFDPAGRRVATLHRAHSAKPWDGDHVVRIWDVKSRRVVRTLGPCPGVVQDFAFAPDGTFAAAACYRGTGVVWSLKTGRVLTRVAREHEMERVAVAPDSTRVAFASSASAALVDAATWEEIPLQPTSVTYVDDVVAFSKDGAVLASGYGTGVVLLFDARTGKELRALKGHNSRIEDVDFAQAADRLVTASNDKSVRVWDTTSGYQVRALEGHTKQLRTARCSPNGRWVVSHDFDRSARLWRVRDGHPLQVIADAHGVAFGEAGRYWMVVTGSGSDARAEIRVVPLEAN